MEVGPTEPRDSYIDSKRSMNRPYATEPLELTYPEVVSLQIPCLTRVLALVRKTYPRCVTVYCGLLEQPGPVILPDAQLPEADLLELVRSLYVWAPETNLPRELVDPSELHLPGSRVTFEATQTELRSIAPSRQVADAVLTRCAFESTSSKRWFSWVKGFEFEPVPRGPVVVIVNGRSFWGKRFAQLAVAWPPNSVLVGFALSSRQRTAAGSLNPHSYKRIGRGKMRRGLTA